MAERVLVVEDRPEVRLLLRRYLAKAGYDAESAESAERALEVLAGGDRFDLYLIDLTLPGMQGDGLAERIYELCPAARVLLTSGDPGPEKLAGSPDRRIAFLQKPFLPAELVKSLRAL